MHEAMHGRGFELIRVDHLNNPLEKYFLNRAKDSSMDLTEARKRAQDHLQYTICQNGQPLERCVEDFLEYSHLVSWRNSTINACFWIGVDDD